MNSKKGNIDETYVEKIKQVEDEHETGTEGGWIPWSRAVDLEGGESLLLEMVAAKTVLTRRNIKLPLDSKIAYPSTSRSSTWSSESQSSAKPAQRP